MTMTVSGLHKQLSELIAAGHGRKPVCINKRTFNHRMEEDGAVILPVESVSGPEFITTSYIRSIHSAACSLTDRARPRRPARAQPNPRHRQSQLIRQGRLPGRQRKRRSARGDPATTGGM